MYPIASPTVKDLRPGGPSKVIRSDFPHLILTSASLPTGVPWLGHWPPHRGEKQCLFPCCVGAVDSTGKVRTGKFSSRNLESSSKLLHPPQSPVSEDRGYSSSLDRQQALRTAWEVLTESLNAGPVGAYGVNPVSESREIRNGVLLWVLSPIAWV